MPTLIGPREAVAFGTSTRAQREAWTLRHWVDRSDAGARDCREAGAKGSIAEAYAAGWARGMRHTLTPAQRDHMSELTWQFCCEYTHASWLYLTERTYYREGYANAWEKFLQAHGYEA